MLALVAITTACIAVAGCGYWIRRQLDFRACWVLLALGQVALVIATIATSSNISTELAPWAGAAAFVLLAVSSISTVRAEARSRIGPAGAIDMLAVFLAVSFGVWTLLIESGWSELSSSGQVLIIVLAVSLAAAMAALVLASSVNRYPPVLTSLACATSFAVGMELNLSGGREFTLALVAACVGILASTRISTNSNKHWNFAQRLRNTLVVYVFLAATVIVGVVATINQSLPADVALVILGTAAALFLLRFSHAYAQIVTLQTSVSTRNAIIRMPMQAVGVRSHADYRDMLSDLARVAAEIVHADRGELHLLARSEGYVVGEQATWGLTDSETLHLGSHPRLDYETLSSPGYRPFVLPQNDRALSVAAQNAWALAGKSESLVIPLHSGDRLLGHLEVWSSSAPLTIDSTCLSMAADLGREAGMMIEHAQLMISSRGEIIEAEMMLTVSEVIARAESLSEGLPIVAERLLHHAEADRVTISLIDEDARDVHIVADARNISVSTPTLQGNHWPTETWASYLELRESGRALAYAREGSNTPERIQQIMELHGAESYLAIPGYTNGRFTSIVQIMSSARTLADSDEVRSIWHSTARQIQLGIESIRALEQSRQREMLESMRRRINEVMQTAERLQDVYATIADLFRSIEEIDGATILSVDNDRDEFVVEAEWTHDPICCRPVGQRHQRNEIVILEDIHQETSARMRWVGQAGMSDLQRDRLAVHNIGAAIATPLRIEDRLVGVLMLYAIEQRPFFPEIVELSEQLAGTIAIVVKSVGLRTSEAEQREEQTIKLRMLQAATSHSDPNDALRAVADAGLRYGGAESIDIAFINDSQKSMVMAADSTIPEWPGVEEPGTVLPISPGSIQHRALQTLLPQHFSSTQPDLGEWEVADIAEYNAHSWICAPLRVGGQAVGFLQVLSTKPDAFDARRIRMWDEVAQQVALVISTLQVSFDNQRLSRQQQLLSRIHEASGALSSESDMYRTIADAGLSLSGVDSSALFIWHKEDGILEVAAHLASDPLAETFQPGWKDVPHAWIDDDEPIRPRPVSHFCLNGDSLSASERSFLVQSGCGRAAIFMLIDEGHVQGVLILKSEDREPFPDETIQLGESVASTSAAIVRNLTARSGDRRAKDEQRALLELSHASNNCSSEHELFEFVATAVRRLCDGSVAEIYIQDGDSHPTKAVARSAEESWHGISVNVELFQTGNQLFEAISDHASSPIIVHDRNDERIGQSLRFEMENLGIGSMAFLAFALGETVHGHVAVYSDQPRRFSSASIRSTATFMHQAAMALQHTRQRLEEDRVADQRAILLRVSQAAGSSLDLGEVLSEIAVASLGVANSESCAIELIDPESNEMILAGMARIDDWIIAESLIGKRRAIGSWGIDQHVLDSGSVLISSIDDQRINTGMLGDLKHFNTQSVLAHALQSGGATIGVYYCFARHANAYVEQDRWLTSEIAAHVVSAIQNARMLEHEHQIAQERERLLHIAEAATRSLDLHDVLHEIANATLGLAGAESCHVELVDFANQEFITGAYAAVSDWKEDVHTVVGNRCQIGAWSIDHDSISGRDPISIGSQDDPRVVGNMLDDMVSFGTQSILLIPIWNSESCVGILNIYARRRNAFSDAQQTIAYTLATHAANAIQNAQTHERERNRRRYQESLLKLTSAATSSLEVNPAMHAVCQAVCTVTGAESAVVALFHKAWNSLEIVADVTVPDWDFADVPGRMYPIANYAVYDLVMSGSGSFSIDANTPDAALRVNIDTSEVGLATYALVPLWLNDVCLGYLGLFDRQTGRFGSDVLELMDEASPMIGLALSNGLQWQDEQLRASDRAAVVAVGRIAVSDAEIGLKLTEIANTCLALNRVDGVAIYQWDEESESLEILVGSGNPRWRESGQQCDVFPMPSNHWLRPFVESREPTAMDLSSSSLTSDQESLLGSCQAGSLAIFPMSAEERLTGAIVLYGCDPYSFSEETVRAGQEIATQTALSIRASRLLETTRRYARQQSALLSVNQAVMNATQTSIGDVLHQISNETMRLIGAECCEIEVLLPGKDATEMLAQVVVDGWGEPSANIGRELSLSDWPVTRIVLETQRSVLLDRSSENLSEGERSILFGDDTESGMIAPMIIDFNSVGVISFYSRALNAFSDEDSILAREFGGLAALAIDRARTHMALAEQASYDGLTGLLNHRALLERIDHHLALSDRSEDPVSLLMIDLNDFKLVNDVHGHIAGDFVLRETAAFLRTTFRASDLVGRYGGDEFVAVLPGTDIVQAIALSQRVQESLEQLEIVLPSGAIVVPSTAIGFASYPGQAGDVRSLIDAADRSMYEVKNRIATSLEPDSEKRTDQAEIHLIG